MLIFLTFSVELLWVFLIVSGTVLSFRMSVIESFSLNYGVSKFAVDGMSVSGFTIHLSPSLVSMTFRLA